MHAIATTDIGTAPGLTAGRRVPARLLHLAGDERLVNQVRGGSMAAFDALYDRHHRGVLAFCRHMLGSVEEAEDAVQHTFMVAYRDLAATDKTVRWRPWLYTIARNRCLSVLRVRREQPLDTLAEPATEHLAAEVQRREDLRDLLRDLSRLPDDQRAALVLAELGDVPHDEIAHVLGCAREKVKALVFQARSSLQASRAAREAPCTEIREQLASLRGGSLRRTTLRRHLRECPGCREFRRHVRAQRRALAVVLPVAPTAGLKEAVLASAMGGGAASGAGALAVGGAACGAGTFAAKALVVVTVASGGAAAGTDTLRDEPATAAIAPALVLPAYERAPVRPVTATTPTMPATGSERPAREPRGGRAPKGGAVKRTGGRGSEGDGGGPGAAKPTAEVPAPGAATGQHPAPGQPSGTAGPAPAAADQPGGEAETEVDVDEEVEVAPGGGTGTATEPAPSSGAPAAGGTEPSPAEPDPPPPPAEEIPPPSEEQPADPDPVVGEALPDPTPAPTPDP